ncbi:hypothetical protein DSM112329_04402 [Paraconexibacter sp. AEG42_29]|uniref:DUF4126 domain-containing protein n=1 Tax=Paraconexibacter sp. AEG42_29 TaxID=2997339 RepID=A0AAU7B1T3_9ACTN
MPAPDDADLRAALLIGVAAGLRGFAPLGVTALRGGFGDGPAAKVLPALAAGELVGDKLPFTPPRTDPPPLLARALSGGLLSFRRAGAQGALVGAAVAVVAAYGGQHTRQWLVRTTGRPDRDIAIAEDVLALALAFLGTRPAVA